MMIYPCNFSVVKIDKTIYIERCKTENSSIDLPPAWQQAITQGIKFEQYMYADGPDVEQQPEKSSMRRKNTLRFSCVATFHGHRLLYSYKQKYLEGHPDVLDKLLGHIPTHILLIVSKTGKISIEVTSVGEYVACLTKLIKC
jgi:hypothetical protein